MELVLYTSILLVLFFWLVVHFFLCNVLFEVVIGALTGHTLLTSCSCVVYEWYLECASKNVKGTGAFCVLL